MATFKRTEHNPVILQLLEDTTRTVITKQILPANSIEDTSWQKIYFKPILNSAGRTYRLSITSPGTPAGKGITVYQSKSDKYAGGEAFLNNVTIQADLVFQYTCRLPNSMIS